MRRVSLAALLALLASGTVGCGSDTNPRSASKSGVTVVATQCLKGGWGTPHSFRYDAFNAGKAPVIPTISVVWKDGTEAEGELWRVPEAEASGREGVNWSFWYDANGDWHEFGPDDATVEEDGVVCDWELESIKIVSVREERG
jgi:hypothetical protein